MMSDWRWLAAIEMARQHKPTALADLLSHHGVPLVAWQYAAMRARDGHREPLTMLLRSSSALVPPEINATLAELLAADAIIRRPGAAPRFDDLDKALVRARFRILTRDAELLGAGGDGAEAFFEESVRDATQEAVRELCWSSDQEQRILDRGHFGATEAYEFLAFEFGCEARLIQRTVRERYDKHSAADVVKD